MISFASHLISKHLACHSFLTFKILIRKYFIILFIFYSVKFSALFAYILLLLRIQFFFLVSFYRRLWLGMKTILTDIGKKRKCLLLKKNPKKLSVKKRKCHLLIRKPKLLFPRIPIKRTK